MTTATAITDLTTALINFLEEYKGHTFDAEFDLSTALHEYMDLEHDLPSQVIGPNTDVAYSFRYSVDAEVFYEVLVYKGKLFAQVLTIKSDKSLYILEGV